MTGISTVLPQTDTDAQETKEWLDALAAVVEHEGPERAHYLIETLIATARQEGEHPLLGHDRVHQHDSGRAPAALPGRSGHGDQDPPYIRWNAMAMVVRANKDTNVGGHIASFASAAALYDVGFSHFWHAPPRRTTAT